MEVDEVARIGRVAGLRIGRGGWPYYYYYNYYYYISKFGFVLLNALFITQQNIQRLEYENDCQK
jgi:hypothetical protein